jgi:hypothetical protein
MLQLARMHANEHRVGAGVNSIHDYVPSATARGRLGAQKTPERMLRSYARDSRVRGATVRTLSGEWSSNLDQPLRTAGAGASLMEPVRGGCLDASSRITLAIDTTGRVPVVRAKRARQEAVTPPGMRT